jgi:hypothetical protein
MFSNQRRPMAGGGVYNGNVGALATLPEPMEMGKLVVQTVIQGARRNPVLSSTYVIGILLLLIVGNGIPLTIQQSTQYNRIMDSINLQAEYKATEQYYQADQMYRHTRGFLGWSCDNTCQIWKRKRDQSLLDLQKIRQEGAAQMKIAKNVAGVWSEIGISELKDSFWSYFNAGKKFAQRQSMWDIFFIGLRSMTRGRDESQIEFILKVLFQVLMNISMGLFMCFIFFVSSLYSIISSYQPNILVAILTFIGATAAAFSFVTTYLIAVYGAAATGVYGLLKVVESVSRAQLADQHRQQQRMEWNQRQQQQQQQRPHYE